ncbi:retrotransposable element ORF2 protein [Plecturocebus cupreus]
MTKNAKSIGNKSQNRQMGPNKTPQLLHAKETVIRVNRQPIEWEKNFAVYPSDKGLISRIYKELKQIYKKKQTSPFKKRVRQENHLNLGGRDCSEPRLCHCTPAWPTRVKLHLKKEEKRKEKRREGQISVFKEFETSHGNMMKPCVYIKNTKISWVWWYLPVFPAIQEAEVGGLFEPRKLKLQSEDFLAKKCHEFPAWLFQLALRVSAQKLTQVLVDISTGTWNAWETEPPIQLKKRGLKAGSQVIWLNGFHPQKDKQSEML